MNMQSFRDILEAWNNPQMKHAMVVHLPIALSIIAAVLGVVLAVRPSSAWVRALALLAVLLLAGSAWMASNTGEGAEHEIEGTLAPEAGKELDEHEDMGVLVWFFAACAGGVVLVTFVPQRTIQHIAGAAAGLGLVFIMGWTAVVAHHGGTLVYEHGVGPPLRAGADTGGSARDPGDGPASPLEPEDRRLVHFEQVVRPILQRNCWGCHNPARSARNGDLDLTTMNSILAGGRTEEEKVVVPGDVERSLMIRAVRYDDEFLQMPPLRKGPLAAEDVAALEEWVRQGAVWADAAPADENPPPPTLTEEEADEEEEAEVD